MHSHILKSQMPGIQIFGIPLSTVRCALVAFHELNVPYELRIFDFLQGQNKLPENLQHQSFGLVPCIRDLDSNVTLFESRAIARYVVDKFDGEGNSGLLPDRRRHSGKGNVRAGGLDGDDEV